MNLSRDSQQLFACGFAAMAVLVVHFGGATLMACLLAGALVLGPAGVAMLAWLLPRR